MIYCTTQKPEHYNVIINGKEYGLWRNYGYDPALFNLISRTQLQMFGYEQGMVDKIPSGQQIVQLPNIREIEFTLQQRVDGTLVRELVEAKNPEEMFDIFRLSRPSGIAIIGSFGDLDSLLLAMRLRVIQWKKFYRGKLRGNEVQFRSRCNEDEEEILSQWIGVMGSTEIIQLPASSSRLTARTSPQA